MFKAAAAILLSILTLLPHGSAPAPEREQVGTQVGEFSSVCITGEPIDGSVFGEYEVCAVVYWATWSAASVDQLAILSEITEAHPEYGMMALLHTDATSTPEAALAICEEHEYGFPVFVCDEVWQALAEESMYIPQWFIVDSTGLVVEVWHAAFTSPDQLEDRLGFWAGGAFIPDGDADLNGVIESVDALMILRATLSLITLTDEQAAHADVDCDGMITSMDALLVLRRVLYLID